MEVWSPFWVWSEQPQAFEGRPPSVVDGQSTDRPTVGNFNEQVWGDLRERDQHKARVSNGPTEGMNNLLKRVKRGAFGFTNFENFRIRALLYAGRPNFRVLDSIVVR
jgi:hypothetical protein